SVAHRGPPVVLRYRNTRADLGLDPAPFVRSPMPELPDVTVYVEALSERIVGARLERVLIASPFLLRSVAPPIEAAHGQVVREVRRVGKRIAIGLEGGLWLVFHLMIAGRLHWFAPGASGGK